MTGNIDFDVAAVPVCAAWIWLSVRTTSCLRTITRGTARHSPRIVWLIKVFATIVASSNVIGIAVSLGLHWIISGLLGAVIVLFALADKPTELVPPKPPQVTSAYIASWKEYSRLRKKTILLAIAPVLVVVSWFALEVASGNYLTERAATVLFRIVTCVAILSFVGYAYSAWKFNYWPCPRCGNRFRSWDRFCPKMYSLRIESLD